MEVFNTLVSDDRPADKAKNNSVIEKPFFKSFSFFCLEERVNILCAASQVSDAHSSSAVSYTHLDVYKRQLISMPQQMVARRTKREPREK